MAAELEGVLDFRLGKGVIGKWAVGWFVLSGRHLEQYGAENGKKTEEAVKKVFDLSDANDFGYDVEKNEIALQCGNERIRLRGPVETVRAWYDAMRKKVPQAPPANTFEPPTRVQEPIDNDVASAPDVSARAAASPPDAETPVSPRSSGDATSPSGRKTRKSFFQTPLEHLKSHERLDPSVATSLSKASQMLLTIFYQLDTSKLRTSDLVRRIDTSGDGEISRSELRKGLVDYLGLQFTNDEFKELMGVLDADQSDSISVKEFDRALKKAAKGEDVVIEKEAEEVLYDAMLQIDTVSGIAIDASNGDSMYVARAKWKDDEKGKGPKTEARPANISGAATEDCAIRQQLKLIAKKTFTVAVLSVCRRAPDGFEELVGQVEMNVHSEEHHDVHLLPLLTEAGAKTGTSVRLRIKLKTQKPQFKSSASTMSLARMGSSASLASPRSEKKEEEEKEEPGARLEKLYKLHAEKQKRMEEKRQKLEAEHMEKLQQEANDLRSKSIKATELCPKAAADRLYRDSKARMRRRREHQYAHYQKEEDTIRQSKEESRRYMSRSLSEAELISSVNAGNRLHDHAINKQLNLEQKIKEKSEAEVREAKEKASRARSAERGSGQPQRASSAGAVVPERLYLQGMERKQKKDQELEKAKAEEREKFMSRVVGSTRYVKPQCDCKGGRCQADHHRMRSLGEGQLKKDRFVELHDEHQKRVHRQIELREESRKKEDASLSKAIEEGRARARQNLDKTRSTSRELIPWHVRLTQTKPKPEDPSKKPPAVPKPAPKASGVDYILDHLMCSLRLRCSAFAPPDKKLLYDPLKKVVDDYKEALTQCTKIEGFSSLASRPSMRLYPDGHLLPDHVGWQYVSEPGPVRQVQDDLEDLMVTAERAQVMLESLIAPKSTAWKPGEQRPKPSAVPMASFAYSHGVKSMEAARTKAMVRYGPAESDRRHRHVLDLARIGLVFLNCDFLQDGLDLILSQFEVVDVRNGFRNPPRSGERFVEVLVILEVGGEGEEPIPHVCEIRLEEINFYNARLRAEAPMQNLLGAIRDHYTQKNPSCMAQLTRWVLSSTPESHGLRIFKKHLARRFGSAVGAWRRRCGRLVSFSKFRDLCKELKYREHASEYWQELDIGRSGCVSLFEVDPQLVCMLATFRARLLKLAGVDAPAPEELWAKLTANVQLARDDRMHISEFTAVLTRSLDFSSTEATGIFDALDAEGGHTFNPPGRVSFADIAWLTKLPNLVDLDCVALRVGGFQEDLALGSQDRGRTLPGSASGADTPQSGGSESPHSQSLAPSPSTTVTAASPPATPSLQLPVTSKTSGEPSARAVLPAEPAAVPAPNAAPAPSPAPQPAVDAEEHKEFFGSPAPAPVAPAAPAPAPAAPAPAPVGPGPVNEPAGKSEEKEDAEEEEEAPVAKQVTLQAEPEIQEMEVEAQSEGQDQDEEEWSEEEYDEQGDGLPTELEDETF